MARTVHEAKITSRTARKNLEPGRQPHWQTLVHGQSHLGWQRWPQDRAGRWVLRRRRGSDYSITPIGTADDAQKADGLTVFDFEQARARAVELSSAGSRPAGRLTVQRCMVEYLDHLTSIGKSTGTAEIASTTHILPALGTVAVDALTKTQLQKWLAQVASQPARKRTAKGAPQQYKRTEDVRKRRASANRMLKVLRAALNHAFAEGTVSSNKAWATVKPFRQADAARVRYLKIDEASRLINASDPEFRPLVRAALETGARYGELAALRVADFNPDSGTVAVFNSKKSKARHVVLTDAGIAFFAAHCAGRAGAALMFTRANGEPWKASNQNRFMDRACARANIVPRINFHACRHTWASHAVMAGVPILVVAANLGHTTTKVTEQNYAHLARGFVVDAIRAGAPRFAVDQSATVAPLSLAGARGKRKIS
jgi:integrase